MDNCKAIITKHGGARINGASDFSSPFVYNLDIKVRFMVNTQKPEYNRNPCAEIPLTPWYEAGESFYRRSAVLSKSEKEFMDMQKFQQEYLGTFSGVPQSHAGEKVGPEPQSMKSKILSAAQKIEDFQRIGRADRIPADNDICVLHVSKNRNSQSKYKIQILNGGPNPRNSSNKKNPTRNNTNMQNQIYQRRIT